MNVVEIFNHMAYSKDMQREFDGALGKLKSFEAKMLYLEMMKR